jgi:hypothetical protein
MENKLLELCSRSPRNIVEHPIYRLGELPYFYIPIEEQERSLNEIFGTYQIGNIRTTYLASHVQVTLNLRCFFDGQKYVQEGIGIEQYEGNVLPISVSSAKSKAISDAAENFGAYFGRNLNRQSFKDTQEKSKEDEETEKRLVALEKTIEGLNYKQAKMLLDKSEFKMMPKLINLVNSKQ